MELADSVRDSINDAIAADIDSGSSPEVRFFVTGGASPTGEASAILLNATNSFNASSGGVMTINTSSTLEDTSPTGNASPVIRMYFYKDTTDADTAWLLQCGVATSGTPDVTMANNVIDAADEVQLSSFSITCPAGTPDTT
jgi:hypothetical protein